MGITERKEREKNERRAMILDRARELILERGVDSVTMQDIAASAELSKGTLYLYFDNKEAILAALFREAGSYFLEYVAARLDTARSGLEAIRLLWMSYFDLFGESNDIIVLFSIRNVLTPSFPLLPGTPEAGDIQEPYLLLGLIQNLLSRGIADGSFDPALDPAQVARTVIIITDGIIENIARLPPGMRTNRLILQEMKSTFELILRAIVAPGCDRSLLILPLGSGQF